MSMHVVKVPDIGEGIAEVELVAWHVAAGDPVSADQTIADVMTDKATVEIPSPVAGRVVALGGKVGEKLAVGSELVRIDGAAHAINYSHPTKLAKLIRDYLADQPLDDDGIPPGRVVVIRGRASEQEAAPAASLSVSEPDTD